MNIESNKCNKGLVVAIEGLIGAGKSTLTNNLCQLCGYTAFNEPVESNPFLVDYYDDPTRWAYAMQVNLLWERFRMFQEATYRALRGELCIADRSIYGDAAFALVQYKDKYFTDKEFKSYKTMHETIQPLLPYCDLVIWLELSPEDTLERIKKRSRTCESNIPIEYLQDLYEAYQSILKSLEGKCKIVRIDAKPEAHSVLCRVMEIIADERVLTSNDNDSLIHYR